MVFTCFFEKKPHLQGEVGMFANGGADSRPCANASQGSTSEQHGTLGGVFSNDFNSRMEKVMASSILRLPEVKTRVGLSRSAIYLAVSRAEFPRPVQLGARAVGWLESEIEEWIRERVKQSRKQS